MVIGGPGGIDWSKEQLPDQTCGNHHYENESDGSGSKKPNVAERYGTVPFWKNGHVRPLPIVHPLNPSPKNVALASRFPALAGYLRSQAGRGRLRLRLISTYPVRQIEDVAQDSPSGTCGMCSEYNAAATARLPMF